MNHDAAPWIQLFGRLHPMVLHLPIGLLVGLVAVELFAAVFRKPAPLQITRLLVWLIALSAILAAATGYIFSREDADHGWTLTLHMCCGIAVAVAAVLMALVHTVTRKRKPYTGLLILTVGLLLPTGHLGASMTYGSNFLFAPFARRAPTTAPAPQSAGSQPGLPAEVAAIFDTRCIICHGPDRQKGGLALHTEAAIAKGSEDGPIFVAGKPAESAIVHRLRLPIDDDDHMPPSSKKQLTEEQIQAIEQWIANGAPISVSPAASAPSRESAEPSKEVEPAPSAAAPAARKNDVPPADPSAIKALRDHLVHVEAVAPNSNRLWVDFAAVSARMDDDKVIALIEPLIPQLDTLAIGRGRVGDETADVLSRATHLRRLDLHGTKITDAGVKNLSRLGSLQQLVLTGTHLTDEVVDAIAAMPALKEVFLWKSGLSPEAVSRLRELRPELRVNAGDTAVATSQESEQSIQLSSEAPMPGQSPAEAALMPVNVLCPVSGKPIDPRYTIVYEKRAIGFCCPKCPGQFWADPKKYIAKLPPVATQPAVQ